MTLKFPSPIGSLGSAVQRIKTTNILAPLLALTVICGFMALGLTFIIGPHILAVLLWTLFALCVAGCLTAYVGWSFKDPDRLQTEDYQLARYQMQLIGDERDPNSAKMIDAAPIANTMIETAP